MAGKNGSGIFLFICRRDIGVPRHARLLLKIGRFPRHWRDGDQVVALGALNLPPGMLFIALKMLFTVRT
jgi:hypothetical protein